MTKLAMFKLAGALPVLALAFGIGSVGALAPATAHADQLLMKRVQQEAGMDLPRRGMTMAQVERKYGAPQRKLSPRGGDSARHPVIHRWEYADYIVYFERSHVIHSVLNTPAGNNKDPSSVH